MASGSKKSVAQKQNNAAKDADNNMYSKASGVSGWIQDVSVEAPVSVVGASFAPGEREVEFSVAMRRHPAAEGDVSELRGRAMVHARGQVLALAEASFVAVNKDKLDDAELVERMYVELRPALQQALALVGHNPPLPETLQKQGE